METWNDSQRMLNRVLRLCAGTWEGDANSFSANILNGITRLVFAFGDQLNDEIFKEKVGALSIKQLVRMSKERCPGSMGYAEAKSRFCYPPPQTFLFIWEDILRPAITPPI